MRLSTNDLLINLATAIHGEHWQNATARDLGVNVRQVHRWKVGEYEVPDGVITDLAKIAVARVDKLGHALAYVKRANDSKNAEIIPIYEHQLCGKA